jgi:3-deoxy-D-manno-octulosonic-acid transferase
MFVIYDLIFFCITLFFLPVYLFKGKLHSGLIGRLGVLPRSLNLDSPIWVHAVSVGEAMAVRGLVEELRKIYPAKKFVISTVTATGNKIAKGIIKDGDLLIYLPLDISFIVNSVVRRIKPAVFIIAETELWPNLISSLAKNNIPSVVVNARISDASFKGYSCIGFLMRRIFRKINLFCAQTELDAQRLTSLGVSPQRIKITGNMKFDQLPKAAALERRVKLGLSSKEKLLIAGSTHAGEESAVLQSYKKLLNDSPYLRLMLVPRHPERSKSVAALVEQEGFAALRISELSNQLSSNLARSVFILDTVGELVSYYAAADIVFVGGSLIKRGGQNILEPASLFKPVIFGPYMYNFRDIVRMFLGKKAALMINNKEELTSAVASLLFDDKLVAELTTNAKEIISNNQGATLRNTAEIQSILKRDTL